MVAKSLHTLFYKLAIAEDEHQLRMNYMDTVGEHFGAQRWGISMLDGHFRSRAVDIQGISKVEKFLELYEKVGRAVDPVMGYVMEYHAPAHEKMVLPPDGWKQSQLYKNCCGYYDHEHIMTGPIVGDGQLIGALHFARVGDTKAFTHQDIIELSAVCIHMSACLAKIQTQQTKLDSSLISHLTPREIQIAELVAQGLTNKGIGSKLWISPNSVKQALKRMFRKLEVSTRAEMVGKLSQQI